MIEYSLFKAQLIKLFIFTKHFGSSALHVSAVLQSSTSLKYLLKKPNAALCCMYNDTPFSKYILLLLFFEQ